jgi:predicted amidohydrolase
MKIGLAQIDCAVGNVKANCRRMSGSANQAAGQGCDLVVFPELADVGGDMDAMLACATPWGEGACAEMQGIARGAGVALIVGLSEKEGDTVYNALAVIDAGGALVGKYRKCHLFSGEPVFEHRRIRSGDAATVVELGGIQIGLSLCYDTRFPEFARVLALRGAQVIVTPAAWPFPRLDHWRLLTTCRAIENQLWVAAVNRVGTDGPLTFCGASRLIDPWGTAVAGAAEQGESLVVGEIDLNRIADVRSRQHVYPDRRPELYGDVARS